MLSTQEKVDTVCQKTLLNVINLAVSFRSSDGDIEAVKGVSFSVNKGETVALVGESGSGKSVIALSILQLLSYTTAYHPTGSIKFKSHELLGAGSDILGRVRGNRISMIFQEPMTALNPLHTIEKQIAESLILHKDFPGNQIRKRVIELLGEVGIQNADQRLGAFPHELSGGQRQRVMIAMALANEPDLLIADEPTTALDVTLQAQILELLTNLQRKFGMALLFITHDLGVVEKIADRVCVMEKGSIVESGDTKKVFSTPAHAYTKQLLDAEPKGSKLAIETTAPVLLESKEIKVWFPIREGLLRRVVDYVRAVDGMNIKIHEGETVGIVGESGSGKTTLGMALLKLQKSEGVLRFDGKDLQNLKANGMRPFRRQMQVVFQDPFGSLSPRMTVGQIVEEGLRIHEIGENKRERDDLVINVLEEVGIQPVNRNRYPHEFSGGQRQRIAIARALVLRPRFIVLDEPTSALDRSVQAQIVDLLRTLQARHKLAYLFISHDLKVVKALADRVIVMRHGKLVEEGDSSRIFEAPRDSYTQELIMAAFQNKTSSDFLETNQKKIGR
ncbi:MAG: microcin ABC transporter ATP-binding protein [Rhodospirillaceae bacterium]|nr:microcin ABC transporter ATP-binding protein [Rhodospirillaceae bacterium]